VLASFRQHDMTLNAHCNLFRFDDEVVSSCSSLVIDRKIATFRADLRGKTLVSRKPSISRNRLSPAVI